MKELPYFRILNTCEYEIIFLPIDISDAISSDNITLMEKLIINCDDTTICKIISKLIINDKYSIFQTLLPYFEKVLFSNIEKYFFTSIYYGSKKFINFFMDKDIDITIQNNMAIRLASHRPDNSEIILELLYKGADVHADDDYALKMSSQNGYLNNLKVLIEAGANIHASNDQALCEACKCNWHYVNKETTIKYLIEAGANVNANNGYPLRHFVRSGYYNIVKILLDAGADTNNIHSSDIILLVQEIKFENTLKTMRCLKKYDFDFTIINENFQKNDDLDNIFSILADDGVDLIQIFKKILLKNNK